MFNIFTAFGFFGISALNISQFWSSILDVVAPKNESRPHQSQFVMEYFLHNEKNVYVNLIHISIALFIGATIVIAIGTIQITYIQHTCGMFKIARYAIDKLNMKIRIKTILKFK